MAVLPIRFFPDPILRQRTNPVKLGPMNARLSSIIRDLTDTLYAQPHGIGIAAPQVGEALQVIIVDLSPRESSKSLHVMINPRIEKAFGICTSREGCMSLPDYTATVKRAQALRVSWHDPSGRVHRMTCEGLEAICVQHEVDHLRGVLFVDRVGCLKTDVFARRR